MIPYLYLRVRLLVHIALTRLTVRRHYAYFKYAKNGRLLEFGCNSCNERWWKRVYTASELKGLCGGRVWLRLFRPQRWHQYNEWGSGSTVVPRIRACVQCGEEDVVGGFRWYHAVAFVFIVVAYGFLRGRFLP
jgi:hypothetical protein